MDIDIALDTMMGADFAKVVQEVYTTKFEGVSKGFGVIKANPDKSKHLETATINLENLWIDFVNLRKEEYASDSRIPVMSFGTPKEDADRRDLTINALFFNINEGKVEDFTGKGIEDLKNGFIRTPLDPLQTFMDDPLRILRVFRFASRYGFTIDPLIDQAIKNKEVLDLLMHKVSRERVGKEIEPALEHKNALLFLNYIHKADLLPIVFEISDRSIDKITIDELIVEFNENSKIWNRILAQSEKYSKLLLKANLENQESTRLYLVLGSLLWGFNSKKLTKSMLYCEHFIKECLKLKNKISEDIKLLLNGALNFKNLVETNHSMQEKEITEQLAMFVRDLGDLYPLALLIVLSLPIPESQVVSLIDTIQSKGLIHFHEVKPLLTGNDVKNELKLTGKDIKPQLDKAIRWQATHLSGTKDELMDMLKKDLGLLPGDSDK